MLVRVNGKEMVLAAGMKVRHALIAAGLLDEVKRGGKVRDEAGNEVGLDGALSDGSELVVHEARAGTYAKAPGAGKPA